MIGPTITPDGTRASLNFFKTVSSRLRGLEVCGSILGVISESDVEIEPVTSAQCLIARVVAGDRGLAGLPDIGE